MKKITVLFLCACILVQSFLCVGFKGTTVLAEGLNSIPLSFTVTDSVINPTKPIIYFSDISDKKLYEVNYETGKTREITFVYQPEHIAYANGKIYVCLLKGQHDPGWSNEDQSGAYAIIDAESFTKISEYNILIDPYDITANSTGNVYISGGSGQWTDVRIFNHQGAKIYSSSGIDEKSKVLLHPNQNKLYTVSLSYNTYINSLNVDSNGIVCGSTYDGTFGLYFANNASISPDGKYLFVNFERYTKVFDLGQTNTYNISLVGSIPSASKHTEFDLPNNRFFMCDGTKQIRVFDYDFMEKTGKIDIANNVNKVFYRGGNLIALTSNSSNQISIEIIPSSRIEQIPYDENPEPYSVKLRGAIKDTVYCNNKAYSIDGAYNNLFITDLISCKVIKRVKLPYSPSGLCVSEDKTKLYIANSNMDYPISELDINTGNVLRNLNYEVDADANLKDVTLLHKHIYNKAGKLYLVRSEYKPKLYVFNASTFEFISSPLTSVGDIAFSPDNNYLYCRNTNNGYLYKYSISGDTFSEVSTTNIDCRPPYDSDDLPILLLEDRDEVICKRYIFKQTDLNSFVNSFPEAIYAVNTDANLAVGMKGFYDLKTGLKVREYSFTGAKSFYYDKEGTLFYEKDNTLKISKFVKLEAITSRLSLEENQTFQTVINAVYSDGKNTIVTPKAKFETSDDDIVQVNSAGLITAKRMGNADITVNCGSYTTVINVDVGLGLKFLTLSSGTISPQFDPKIGFYNVELPCGSKIAPTITATTKDSNAKVSINPASSLPGNAEIKVTAKDGSYTCNYIISYTLAKGFESSHPYANDSNVSWEYTEPDFVGSLQITFSTDTAFESSCDLLYISDKTGSNISVTPFSGNSLSGKTITIKGNYFKIHMISDGSLNMYGFKITNITPIPAALSRIDANTDQCSLGDQKSYQLKVDASYADGTIMDVTSSVYYRSEDTSIATVDPNGLITAVTPGNTNIIMEYKGKADKVNVDTRSLDIININNYRFRQLSEDSASISWTNRSPYICRLEYPDKNDQLIKSEFETVPSMKHEFVLKNLAMNTYYKFSIGYKINDRVVWSDWKTFYMNQYYGAQKVDIKGYSIITLYDKAPLTVRYKAVVKDFYDLELPDESVSWSVYNADTGDSLSISDTGSLLLDGNTIPGDYVISAAVKSNKEVKCLKNITIKSEIPEVELIGDYNGDKAVNSIDFAVLRQYLLEIIDNLPVKDTLYVGDLNRDGGINSVDFAILRGYLLGKYSKLPYVRE